MAKNVINDKGLVHYVQCKICTHVGVGKTFLIPKLNRLLKHVKHWECKVSMPKIEAFSYYYNKDSMHSKTKQAYTIHD
jgi:hypothetical protein